MINQKRRKKQKQTKKEKDSRIISKIEREKQGRLKLQNMD